MNNAQLQCYKIFRLTRASRRLQHLFYGICMNMFRIYAHIKSLSVLYMDGFHTCCTFARQCNWINPQLNHINENPTYLMQESLKKQHIKNNLIMRLYVWWNFPLKTHRTYAYTPARFWFYFWIQIHMFIPKFIFFQFLLTRSLEKKIHSLIGIQKIHSLIGINGFMSDENASYWSMLSH